ncbi:hypothetical protein [Paracoccus simplex]|uniref:Uncharacterized protein n=1 Tax=Paracoccus simplex TaxID=2086346 RepID=A0ABV7RVF6_9RHOB
MGQERAYLAGIAALAVWLACGSLAQAQGLVITPLPSDQVIRASEAPAVPPPSQLGPEPAQPAAPGPDAPARPGLPRPSIIVGDLAVLAAYDPRGPLGLPFAAREAIRQRDPALFDRLLGRGAFDPAADRLAEAIQTELQRMDCYGGSIDGDWGSGSARAVERWSQAAKAEAGSTPEIPLFRSIVRSTSLRCAAVAAPVAAQPATASRANASRAASSRESRSAPAARTAPQRAQPSRAAPSAPTTTRQINPSLMGSGMFR